MIVSIYLHKEITDILGCFGKLEDVVNDILNAASEGHYNFENKPACQSREGAARYEVNIVNEDYLTLLSAYPVNSPKISLRRLIYWFVENEIYDELEWKPVRKYRDSTTIKALKKIEKLKSDTLRLLRLVNNKDICTKIISLLDELTEDINE